jgi:hypothetical protein
MTSRVLTAADLASVVIPADETHVVISMPTSFIGDPSEGSYDADTEALWAAIQADLKGKGWEWTGAAGIEEDGSGDWMKFAAVLEWV